MFKILDINKNYQQELNYFGITVYIPTSIFDKPVRYIAVDSDGNLYCFSYKPKCINNRTWNFKKNKCSHLMRLVVNSFNQSVIDSLIEVPLRITSFIDSFTLSIVYTHLPYELYMISNYDNIQDKYSVPVIGVKYKDYLDTIIIEINSLKTHNNIDNIDLSEVYQFIHKYKNQLLDYWFNDNQDFMDNLYENN